MEDEMAYYKSIIEDCWMELETANTWEHISEIQKRMSIAGLRYKELKRLKFDMESPKRQRRGSLSST